MHGVTMMFKLNSNLWFMKLFIHLPSHLRWGGGARGDAVVTGAALHAGRSRVRFLMVSLELFIELILPAALWLWG